MQAETSTLICRVRKSQTIEASFSDTYSSYWFIRFFEQICGGTASKYIWSILASQASEVILHRIFQGLGGGRITDTPVNDQLLLQADGSRLGRVAAFPKGRDKGRDMAFNSPRNSAIGRQPGLGNSHLHLIHVKVP